MLIKKFKWQIFLCILLLFLTLFFILNSSHYINIVLEGIILYGTKILPSLLPFLFITKILSNFDFIFLLCSKFKFLTKFMFNTSQISFYIFFMSIISGYPVGAKLTSEFYEKGLISNQDAQKILSFCSTSGPLFVIGSVGVGFFASSSIGILLFAVHIFSSIINGIIFGHIPFSFKKNKNKTTNKINKKLLNKRNKYLKNHIGLLKISKKLGKNIKKSHKNTQFLSHKKYFTIKNNILKNFKFNAKNFKKLKSDSKNNNLHLTKNLNLSSHENSTFNSNSIFFSHAILNSNSSTCSHANFNPNSNINLNKFQKNETTSSLNLDECMFNSIRSVLIVGGFIVIFYVFLQIMLDYNFLYPLTKFLQILGLNSFEAQGFSAGIFEITKGISIIAKSTNIKTSFILSSFLISFSGISIILQSFAFLDKTKIRKKTFIFQKICHAIISTILAFFVTIFF